MLFKPYHIPLIRSGVKEVTRRNWKKPMVKVGNVYMATTEMFTKKEDCDCWIKVVGCYRQKLKNMTEWEAHREGGYTLEEFKEVCKEINGEWDPNQTVWVVEFEYVGEEYKE